ncbi:OmpH family outer membrane protein [Acidicapsa dinghuensis]|uniref:OmpH family outer membrane protein n=1 Tax=Acidicapsa dinghuensis TaxID=2218256 RepID=A0ABW1EA64_9BACT|nr:OmpH family outer membrane protein [Acidicapsa dinghuensis]
MKRITALAALLASGLVLNAAAQTPAAPSTSSAAIPAKVAVIAFQVAVAQTNEGQRDYADITKKFEPKQTQLKQQNDAIDALKKELQTQGDKLSPAEQAAKTKDIDDKTKQLQRNFEDTRNDYQQAVGDMYNQLAGKVFEVVQSYAKENGYTLVLDGSQQQSPILWAAEATDITKPIIAAYNAKSGVPAPPAGAQSGLPAAPRPATRTPGSAAPKN